MSNESDKLVKNVLESVVKIAVLAVLVIWTFFLIKPFLTPVIWGVILAVASEPFISKFAEVLGGRKKLASILFVLAIISALIIPTVLLVGSSIDSAQNITENIQNKSLVVPPPPAKVADWPLVGDKIFKAWQLASTNLEGALKTYGPQLKKLIGAILSSLGGGIGTLFMVIISTCIAGVFLATSEKSALVARRIITRIAGKRGPEMTDLATATIRGVMQGVVGVAVIQAILSCVGLVFANVPAAGIWAMLVLVLAISQLPPIIVLGPIAVFVFSASDTTTAVIFLVWSIFVSASDGFLKPMLMGRGVDIPMLVILIGAIGGMMLSGIIGLFVGGVVLAIMYTLFMAWIDELEEDEGNSTEAVDSIN
jgi:predicted PurR-regulated permease PerM